MRTALLALAMTMTGCPSAGKETEAEPPVEGYACVHIAEGELVDVALEPEEARTITVGRAPYRVNLYPNEPGYLRFVTTAPADLALLLDFARAVPAVITDGVRTELPAGDPNPDCSEDLPEVLYFSVPAGEHLLEVGPVFQAAVWLMLAPQ